jgi:hypothetical protein
LDNKNGTLIFGDVPAYAVGPRIFQRDDGLLLTFLENETGEGKSPGNCYALRVIYEAGSWHIT